MNLYEIKGQDAMTILSDDEIVKFYSIDNEVVFINDLNILKEWKKKIRSKDVDETFGWYVLQNGYGIELSNEEAYKKEELDELCEAYKYCIIDEKVESKDTLYEVYPWILVAPHSHNSKAATVELIEDAGELTRIYEKRYDDYHDMQIWKDEQNKFYKVVSHSGVDLLKDVLAIMSEEEAEEEIYEMNQWVEQEDCYFMYAPYDDDEVEYIL